MTLHAIAGPFIGLALPQIGGNEACHWTNRGLIQRGFHEYALSSAIALAQGHENPGLVYEQLSAEHGKGKKGEQLGTVLNRTLQPKVGQYPRVSCFSYEITKTCNEGSQIPCFLSCSSLR